MKPGGFAFERWQLKDPKGTPWAANYFDQDQLYNLHRDPTEKNNLAKNPEYGPQLERMQNLLRGYLKSVPGAYPGLVD